MPEIIGAEHQFHDEEFAVEWADRFVPSSDRLELFDLIVAELESEVPVNGYVVELGIGPGFLADHVLKAMPEIHYCGVDFSKPMLDIARKRLQSYSARVAYVQADLVNDAWWTEVPERVSAIASTWALHDLGSPKSIEAVYGNCSNVLPDGGVLLNGDLIKPDNTTCEYESGRFEIAKHLEMLSRVGFDRVACLKVFEEEIESPTSAQNYACLRGLKS